MSPQPPCLCIGCDGAMRTLEAFRPLTDEEREAFPQIATALVAKAECPTCNRTELAFDWSVPPTFVSLEGALP